MNQPKIMNQQKVKYLLLILIPVICIYFNACRRIDVLTSSEVLRSEKFFNITKPVSKRINDIIERLKIENKKTGFVDKLNDKLGMPIWDKMVFVKQSNNQARGLQDTLEQYLIPLSVTDKNLSSILNIKELAIGGFEIKNYTTNDYLYNKVYASSANTENIEKLLTQFFYLENKAFGTKVFYNIPEKYFEEDNHIDSGKVKTVFIRGVITNSNDSYQLICVDIISWCAVCGQYSCKYTIKYRQCTDEYYFDDEGGGGAGSGGSGGGAGGGSPPPEPCINTAFYSVIKNEDGTVECNPIKDTLPVTIDPMTIPDSIPGILSRICDKQMDSLYQWGMQNGFKEQSFILVKKDGHIYPKNPKEGTSSGDEVSVNYSLSMGEILLCYVHIHAEDTSNFWRTSFSPNDLIEFNKNAIFVGYTALLDVGNARYAFVVEDLQKKSAFNISKTGNHKRLYNNLLNITSQTISNGQKATEQTWIQYLGSSSISGIAIYKSTSPKKNTFIKLNF